MYHNTKCEPHESHEAMRRGNSSRMLGNLPRMWRKVVVNRCFGGFELSEAAYEKLIEWGIPVRAYVEQQRDPQTGLYKPEPLNDGEVIFDRTLTPQSPFCDESHIHLMGRYWETWLSSNRSHPLLVRVVEELGSRSHTRLSKLEIVEVPDDVDWEISEYDGREHIAEKHRLFGQRLWPTRHRLPGHRPSFRFAEQRRSHTRITRPPPRWLCNAVGLHSNVLHACYTVTSWSAKRYESMFTGLRKIRVLSSAPKHSP